ncbi:hypothetical protein C8R43DRAFT_1090926 [Mycena crocata]|nr:hypothetical protein C8R43DRAFT_1090926 [Mycena crocata]
MTANHYFTPESASNLGGLSLLFAHCVAAHKEQWEPVVENIFRNQELKPSHLRVHEAWAFDRQNHGDAALLNRDLLNSSRAMGISSLEWAEAIDAFVRSPQMQGKRMVAIGHSAGARTMLLSIRYTAIHSLPYVAFVLIEPTLAKQTMLAEDVAKKGQDRWSNRSEAKAFFAHRSPWKAWDAKILGIYVDSGLEDVSNNSGEVTLKCDRRQETMAYQDVEPDFAEEELERVCSTVPVHFVWATKSGLM